MGERELVAGFNLDAMVDEKVFGHTVGWRNSFAWRTDIIDEIKANSRGFDLVTEARIAGACVPRYSERIADAWLVVEKLRRRGFGFSVGDILNTEWFEVTFDNPVTELSYIVGATTISEAICLAAMEAVCPPQPTTVRKK